MIRNHISFGPSVLVKRGCIAVFNLCISTEDNKNALIRAGATDVMAAIIADDAMSEDEKAEARDSLEALRSMSLPLFLSPLVAVAPGLTGI